jgi:hypothetical protein
MKAFGNTELTTKDLADELQFRVESELGWFPPVALLLLGFAGLIWALTIPVLGLQIVIALAALAELGWVGIWARRSWKKADTTTLSVTDQNFVATGDGLGAAFSRKSSITVPASEVKAIQYIDGGEDTTSGLYLSTSYWKSSCVLPGLNRRQCTAVTVAIVRRFPQIGAQIAKKM